MINDCVFVKGGCTTVITRPDLWPRLDKNKQREEKGKGGQSEICTYLKFAFMYITLTIFTGF